MRSPLPDLALVLVFADYWLPPLSPPGQQQHQQQHRICRIEAILELLRLRLVCRHWRDVIQSDTVARRALGPCSTVTDLTPTTPEVAAPYAWARLFDGKMLGIDPWEMLEGCDKDVVGSDRLAELWMKPLYRQPPVRHWRCGRVTGGGASAKDDGAEYDDDDVARHNDGGDCVAEGAWFDLLVDVTFVDWLCAKLGSNLRDDQLGAYNPPYASIPLILSNQSGNVLKAIEGLTLSGRTSGSAASLSTTADRAVDESEVKSWRDVTLDDDAVLNRKIFDAATANAYVPGFPLRVRELPSAGAARSFFHPVDSDSVRAAEEIDQALVEASRLCKDQCAFCRSPRAGRYFDWGDSDDCRKPKDHNGDWLVKKLVQWCCVGDGSRAHLFAIDADSSLDDITYHKYVFVAHPRTGRLFGALTWRTSGCGP
ncbi:hypothetical protein HK405_004843 [Cladochytrium tenue]|nr:hypothetical protein HK405_004843 [Cladochytrium tenue]